MADKRKTILLVEDEAIVALAEKTVLEGHGYEVMLAHSGQQAIDAAASAPGIDLILMDIDLGRGMDGTEAARKILEAHDIPLVFLSAHTEPEIVEKTEGITSYGYIVKNSGETVLRTSINMAFRLFDACTRESRKAAALEKSEEKYRTLVENMNDIVYAMDLEGRFTYLSPGLERVSGYTTAELIGRNFSGLVYPDDLPRITEDFKKVLGGSAEPHEFRVVDRDGSVLYMRTSSRPVSRGGVVTGITGIMTDITRHRLIEEELLLKSVIFDQVRDFVTITDLDGTITYVNQASVDLYRRPREELIGQSIDILGENPERGATQREILESTLRDGYWKGEVVNIGADGSEHVMDCRTQVVTDASGKPVALFGISTDITGRKLTEQALRESEEQNRMILDNTNLGIFLSTLDGVYLRVNKAALRISGYDTVDDLLGTPMSKLYADPAEREEVVRALREKGSVDNVELRAVRKNGDIHWISLSAVVMKDDHGAPRHIVGVVEDITVRRRAGELIRAERDLAMLLAGAVSIREAVRFGLSAAMSAGGMDGGGVYLFNEAGGLDLAVHEGLSDRFLAHVGSYEPGANSVRIVLAGRSIFADDTGVAIGSETGSLSPSMRSLLKEEGLKAIAILPILIKGEVVACMNLASRVHRTISPHARMALESMASHLGSAILRMRTQEALLQREGRFRSYFGMPLVGVVITTPDREWVEVNDRACEIFGYTRDELKGRTWADLTHPEDLGKNLDLQERVFAGEIDTYTMEKRYVRKNGDIVWAALAVGCVRNPDGSANHFVGMISDITDLKRAEERVQALLEEKELLLREVHHRIKNNMGTITSLLSLQADAIRDPEASKALNDAVGRVHSMKVLYDRLYQTPNLKEMPLPVYLSPLLDDIVSLFTGSSAVRVEKDIADFSLGVKQLSPLGIIVNELVTNAMKYAFAPGGRGTIRVSAVKKGRAVTLTVEDDGRGLPPGLDPANPPGFGLRLVAMLVKQLRGTLRAEKGKGARFVIEFDATD